ncbi:MAG: ATP-binding cassette domain-containing protein, partial [Oscillospiraceae bacterium]|nr:ATP-binding cassette domain-containing protein [Oscillospiraceae bacterium]
HRLLSLVGIDDKANAYPAELWGGQKQRAAIARALASDPQILLCDEATSALDPQTTAEVLKLLKKLNAELGITIIIITHQMNVVKEICTRAAVMENGKVVEENDVFSLFASPKQPISRAFVEMTSNLSGIHALIEEKSPLTELKPGQFILRLKYLERSACEALVSYISREYDINLNIIFGNIEIIGGNPIGGLVVIADGEKKNIEAAVGYLSSINVSVEVILSA